MTRLQALIQWIRHTNKALRLVEQQQAADRARHKARQQGELTNPADIASPTEWGPQGQQP